MFISKGKLRKMESDIWVIGNLRCRVEELEKSLQAIEEFLGISKVKFKVKVPQMQNVSVEVTKYEKKCKKCKCCPSNPVGHQELLPVGGSYWGQSVVFKQCDCKCHTKK